MSRTTKKKYVEEEVLNSYELPTVEQKIVKVIRSCGNNLHEVESPDGEKFLASMPNKFRKHIWIRRGDFVVVDPIEEGVKVKGEISKILLKDQIKYYKDQGVWPKTFEDPVLEKQPSSAADDDELFVNTNRPLSESEEDSSSEEHVSVTSSSDVE